MNSLDLVDASVGQGGQNHAKDVRIVQRLLNDWLARENQPLLKVDGIVGPKTTGAILAFQKKSLPIADGRIDPSGPTIQALFKSHIEGLVGMLDLGQIAKYVSGFEVESISLSDPSLATLIQQYVTALKSNA